MTWRAMRQGLNRCGCERDDDSLSDDHIEKSPDQSEGDYAREHHYPRGQSPRTYCMTHRSPRPCECDRPKKKAKQSPPTKAKGKSKR